MPSKPFYASLTLWGLVVMVITSVLAKIGFHPTDAQTTQVNGYADTIVNVIQMFIGPAMVLIGRWRAKAPLSVTAPASLLLLPLILLFTVGCSSDPKTSATELRLLYTEAQNQLNLAKSDPSVNQVKLQELETKVAAVGPFIDQIQIAADTASKDPTKFLDFQTLYVMYKPQVESILISLVLKRYLGT